MDKLFYLSKKNNQNSGNSAIVEYFQVTDFPVIRGHDMIAIWKE